MPDDKNAEMKTFTPEFYYTLLPKDVREGFTKEQAYAVKMLLKRVVRVPSKKICDLETSFWLFKPFFLTVYLGHDLRKRARIFQRRRDSALSKVIKVFIYGTFLMIGLIILFFLLYTIKSMLGIDIFPDFHLSELWN